MPFSPCEKSVTCAVSFSEGGMARAPVSSIEGGVTYVFVSSIKGGVA